MLRLSGAAAEHRSHCKYENADDEETFSAEEAGQPAADRKDDGVGHQIRREHPSALVVARTKAPRHVRQSHIGDAGVEHLHERGHRHHHADEPGIEFRPPSSGKRRAPKVRRRYWT